MMEFVELIKAVGDLGFPIAIATFAMWYITVKQDSRQDKRDAIFVEEIKKITDMVVKNSSLIQLMMANMGKSSIDQYQTTSIYDLIMNDQIDSKMEFLKIILEKNSINEREDRIKENIKSEFVKITKESAELLSSFISPAGDLGLILMAGIDWDSYLKEIFDVFFSDTCIENKCYDIKGIMKKYKNIVRGILDENIRKNQLHQ